MKPKLALGVAMTSSGTMFGVSATTEAGRIAYIQYVGTVGYS